MSGSETDFDAGGVGDVLRGAREAAGLDVDEAGNADLDTATLRRLEDDDPAEWASDTRMLASLRIYARHLELEPEPLVRAAWRAAPPGAQAHNAPPVEPLSPGPDYPHAPKRRRWLLAGAATLAALLVFAGAIVAALFINNELAINDTPTVVLDDDAEEPPVPTADGDHEDGTQSEASEDEDADAVTGPDRAAGSEPAAEEPAAEEAPDDGLPGRPPQETPVQVVNALRDEQATAEAVELLGSLGYEVVLVDTTVREWPETSVYYNPGWDAEAESLHERDDRFVVGGANEVFIDDAGLHVVIGLDWLD